MSDFGVQPPAAPPVSSLPWERQGAGVGDLVPTLTLVLGRPTEAFARLTATTGVARALIFGLLVYWVSTALGQLWTLALSNAMQELLDRMGGGMFAQLQQSQLAPGLQYVLAVVAAPIVFLIGTLVAAGVVHLCLLLFGGAPGGFETTLRVNAYCAAPSVLLVIPFLGGLIVLVWWIVLLIVGLAAAHRVPAGRAAAAVLVPAALCCACVAVASMLFAATLMAAMGAAAP